jgi:hypothetical protein
MVTIRGTHAVDERRLDEIDAAFERDAERDANPAESRS